MFDFKSQESLITISVKTKFDYHFITSILDHKLQSLNTIIFPAVQVFY